MATTTPNFGWAVPTSTDLVKDGATAIETLGDSIDASLVDLKGGTTGQVLAKATNTDMDFTWVTNAGDIEGVTAGIGISGGGTSGTVTITNSMATAIDAKGDLVAGTGADAFSRIAVGANDTVLMADSSTATGLKWASVPSGGMTLLASGTLSGTSVSLTSISQSYENLIIYLRDYRNSGGTNTTQLQLNGNSSAANSLEQRIQTTTYQVQGTANHTISQEVSNTDADAHAYIFIPDYTSSSVALAQSYAYNKYANTTNTLLFSTTSFPSVNTAITSVQINSPSTWGGGTYELWGQK